MSLSLSKLFVGMTLLTLGLGSAVTATQVMNSTVGEDIQSEEIDSKVFVHPVSVSESRKPFSITMCSDNKNPGRSNVVFGDKTKGAICGEPSDQNSFLTFEDKLTEFFKDKWDKTIDNGSSDNSSRGKAICTGSAQSWVISAQGDGHEYLGLCEQTSSGNFPFLKKTKSDGKSSTLQVCVDDCFEENKESAAGIKNGATPRGSGTDISFRVVN